MAAWQFKFSIVPEQGLLNQLGENVVFLPEYQSVRVDSEERLVSESPNYWEGLELLKKYIDEDMSSILPERDSWNSTAKMYGNEHGDSYEVFIDDIDCALDLRVLNKDFIFSLVNIAREKKCLFVLHENGKVVSPDFNLLQQEIITSFAAKFISNPIGAISSR